MRMPTLAALIVLLSAALGQAQDQPVTNGSFEEVGPNGIPVGWSFLGGASLTEDRAHSGQRSVRLERRPETQGEVGLNRDWAPESGQQGAMLAETKGAIRFWYCVERVEGHAASTGMSVQIIPMTDRALERGGARTVYAIPLSHADGQWHQGALAYDYSGVSDVKWVHVSARLVGDGGVLYLDDFEWVDQIGPVFQATDLTLQEVPGQEGERATVTLTIANIGDAATQPTEATLHLPEGLTTELSSVPVPSIAPGRSLDVEWEVLGLRDTPGPVITAEVATDAGPQALALTLQPRVVPLRLQLSSMVAAPGESITVAVIGRNDGTVAGALDGVFSLTAGDGLTIGGDGGPRGLVRPRTEGEVARWQISAPSPVPYSVVTLSGPDLEEPLTAPVAFASPPDAVRESTILRTSGDWTLSIRPVAPGQPPAIMEVTVDGGAPVLLPRLGLLATRTGDHPLSGYAEPGGEPGLVLTSTREIDGVTWDFRWELEILPEADRLRYRLSATPREDTEYLALEGPMVYLGEGAPVTRTDALVPGLEWLVEGEESSNALDIVPDHPDRVRYVPHPWKITVPSVAMMTDAGGIGLMWDAPTDQASYETAGPLSLVFATPNRFEGHTNHLMGLELPAPGWGVPENSRRAQEPIPLAAGQELVIACELLIDPEAPDSLSLVERWYDGAFPPPLPYPRGSAEDEIRFSMEAYFPEYELWNPEWRKWYSDLIVGFQPTADPAYLLTWASELLGHDPVAQRARELAAQALGVPEADLVSRIQHQAQPGAVWSNATLVASYLASQDEDGLWPWSGEKAGDYPEGTIDYDFLGRVGDQAVGLNTDRAAAILRYAIMTADPKAIEGGLRTLEGLRRFRVPRAAQVWEVPVHTPDILASSRAVDAYLLGYQLTGDARYLDDAVYWARTGLPFVYAWNDPDQPALQGASVPVFGATAYVLSWFGVAVQWNGLAYGDSLYALAQYDQSFPWETVADNILRSAMYQQVEDGPRRGQWPDALNLIEGRPGLHGQTPPCFQPSTILRQHLTRLGVPVSPTLKVVHRGDQFLAIQGIARFGEAVWEEDRLEIPFELVAPQRGAIEVIGIDRPARVLLDGQPIPEAAEAPSWQWHQEGADLEVRVGASGDHVVQIEGARRSDYTGPPVLQEIAFTFEEDPQGWHPAHDLAPFSVEDGALISLTTGSDPYMTRDSLAVPGHAGDVLVIRLSVTRGGGGSVFWGTLNAPGYSPEREIPFPVVADGRVHEVRVPVGTHAAWAGQMITALRIDPTGEAGAEVRIESVSLER